MRRRGMRRRWRIHRRTLNVTPFHDHGTVDLPEILSFEALAALLHRELLVNVSTAVAALTRDIIVR